MQYTERKSLPINNRTKSKVERIIREQRSKIHAAQKIGINRGTLDRLLITGTCSRETLEKIKAA